MTNDNNIDDLFRSIVEPESKRTSSATERPPLPVTELFTAKHARLLLTSLVAARAEREFRDRQQRYGGN